MQIIDLELLPIEGGWYFDDKAAIESDAVSDYYLLKGRPLTEGFRSIREPGSGVGVLLHLDNGQYVYGDGTSVTYAGAAGRDPILRFQDLDSGFTQRLRDMLVGNSVDNLFPLSDEIENTSYKGTHIHTAMRYALSQALLEACALAHDCTKTETLAMAFGSIPSKEPIRFGIQSGEDRYAAVDKAIYRRVGAFPHALIHQQERDLGNNGDALLKYAKWIKSRLEEHCVEKSYQPTVHFDCYGTLGRAFGPNLDRVVDYLVRLEEAISPMSLQVESPVEMESQSAQITALGYLKATLSKRGSDVILIADEWCNTLDDVIRFAEADAVHMIQIKMPDLGVITQSARAVLECKRRGLMAYLGGSCNETDLNARNAVHVAIATAADQVLARPGMGVDEGVSIMRNEESRIRTILRHQV